MRRDVLGFERVRYTEGRTDWGDDRLFSAKPGKFTPDPNGVTAVHFLLPNSSGTWCGKDNGPHPEEVDDDTSVTCQECKRRVIAVFRWWFPRKPFPSWMEVPDAR